MAAARSLAIARNIDVMPPEGAELFTSVYGMVPNDGAPHLLAAPAAAPPLIVNSTYRTRIAWVRVEWSTIDVVIPPPLSLSLLVNGELSIELSALTRLMLQATAIGSPAVEAPFYTEVAPNARVDVAVTNTGTVNQLVAAYLWGWAYAQTLPDGTSYGG